MARSKLNLIRYYAKIIEIVNAHYIVGLTTYAGIWRKYVYPVYPVSYETFMRIVSYPRLQQELEELEAERESGTLRPRVSEVRKPEIWERNQLTLEFAELHAHQVRP